MKESLRHEFYYLVFSASKPGMGLSEYRSTLDVQDVVMAPAMRKGLMLTSGFTSASSVLHPDNWSGADFRYLGRQTVDGLETHVVAFAQKPETAKLVTRFVTDDGAPNSDTRDRMDRRQRLSCHSSQHFSLTRFPESAAKQTTEN